MFNDDSPAGTVIFEAGKVYLRPATFDKETNASTETLFAGYGIKPELLVPANGDDIPEILQDDFPMQDPEAFIYSFNPKPLIAPEPGELGVLNPSKAKDNFRKLHRKKVSLRELAMTFAISRELMAQEKSRR